MRKEQDKVDLLGREIQIGDIIAYPVTVGRSAAMRIGRVVSIDVMLKTEWHGVKEFRVPDPDNGYTMKVQYLEESMNWGIYTDPERDVAYHRKRIHEIMGGYVSPFWTDPMSEREYHETELAKAEKKLAEGPKPKTLLFPGKAVVISCAFPVRPDASQRPLAEKTEGA